MKKYLVTLTAAERQSLHDLLTAGKASALKMAHAGILLKADQAEGGPSWPDERIADALDVGLSTIARVQQRYVEQGLEAALVRKKQGRPGCKRKLDGRAEARLITLACSDPPAGRAAWTLQLLADKLVELRGVDAVCDETVRRVLKKNQLKPWLKEQWCIPPRADAEFVAAMEDVLDVCHRPHDPVRPLVCLDEASKQLVGETRPPLPPEPGQPGRFDFEYVRNGTANLFLISEPLLGWRHVEVTGRRTAKDFAEVLRWLAEELHPDAEKIVRVMDNLNTHKTASLYEAFPPEQVAQPLRARRGEPPEGEDQRLSAVPAPLPVVVAAVDAQRHPRHRPVGGLDRAAAPP